MNATAVTGEFAKYLAQAQRYVSISRMTHKGTYSGVSRNGSARPGP